MKDAKSTPTFFGQIGANFNKMKVGTMQITHDFSNTCVGQCHGKLEIT